MQLIILTSVVLISFDFSPGTKPADNSLLPLGSRENVGCDFLVVLSAKLGDASARVVVTVGEVD